jgi:beta-hydroxylase
MFAVSTLFLIFIFCLASMSYVFLYRGEQRYAGLTEYLRKGWPIASPFNCILYFFTRPKASMPIINPKDFPELNEIKKNWALISQEVQKIYELGFFDQTNKEENSSYYDIGFRTFYKYGWSKFYINWYGYTHESAKKHCPETVRILSKISIVNGAMFSILPPGSKLTRHLDPVACSLRYHLGLKTPNDSNCFINVDGKPYYWKDGEDFMFDETYLHFAKNETQENRIILMCDIDRPLSPLGSLVNSLFKFFLKFSVVPNTTEDKEGLFNRTFSTVTPYMKKVRGLKETNLAAYKAVKYSVNIFLFLVITTLLYSILKIF